MPFVISKDPIEGDFDSDTESKFVIGGEVTPDGAPIYGEDDILTKAGWRYRKKTTDTDILQGAVQAAKGLWNGFAKIPEVVRAKGFTGASGNLPEAMLAAGEGWADIVKTVASKNYAVVTGMNEEQDLDRQYANYREVAERSVEQVKRSRSRVGDFFRAIGAPEHAATMDESIDQEVANSLSMVLDPTNLIGGGSGRALLAAGKGAKVAVAGEKAAVAGEKALQAAEKVSAEVVETTAKVVPPIRDGPAPINWNEPVAKATDVAGKGAEKTGRGLQSVADSLVAWEKANPNWATVGSAAIGAASNDENPLTGAFIGAGARTVLPSILKTAPKALVTAGEAAQVAAIASSKGVDVAAKSGVAGERVSAIAKRLDTPAVNFLLSQSAQLADAAANGLVIGGGIGLATTNDPEVSGLGSGIGAGIVGGSMGRLQSIGIDQAGRVAFHKADADGKWVRVSESPASLAKDQDLAVSFLASKSLPERTVLAERLSVAQLAELARGEAAAKGANRLTGEDMDVRFLDTQGMIDAGFDPLVATAMQGVTETAQKPVLFINLDVATDPAKTLWHEMIHGFDKLAPEEKGGKPTQGATDLGNARAELKALYFGTFDAEGNQITKGKYTQEQMLSLEDQYLSRAMNDAEIAAHKAKPMRERAAYIADEMVAEHAGMLGRLSGGDIGKASRYPTTAMGRATLGVLGRAKGALEALGVKFDGGGEVVTSGIFKDPETGKPLSMSSDVREKLSAYLRAKDRITTRLSIDDAHSPVVETVRAADLMKADATPETLARWKDSGIFKLDDKGEILMQGGKLVDGRMMGGKPVLLSKAERERVEANRSAAIFQAIKSAPDDGTPSLRSKTVDGVEVFEGKVLGKSQLAAILALPDSILPASMKERLSKLVEIQADPGSIGIADYYKALTGGKYDTKASMSVMVFVPVSFKISAAGNLRVTTFSVVGFENKLSQWGKTKKGFFDLWEGNTEAFRNDVLIYLENQGTPEGNVALTKEAIAKKDAINDFIKPFFAGDTDRVTTNSGRDNMIRSLRVDRMQSVSRGVGDKMPYDYEKVKRNFMPADEQPVMGGQARFQPADADYLAAVKSGDMKVVQGMVDEAAIAAGYGVKAYHGTNAEGITTFKKRGVATNFNNAQRLLGYFFASDQKYATQYGKNVMPVFLKGNFSEELSSTIDGIENGGDSNAKQWKKRRADKGFTGAKFGSGTSQEIVVFSPSQIKSADPITRDAQGNVIPLSQRFNTKSEDIRYQPADENAKYSKPPREADAKDALYESKRPFWGTHRGIDEGTPVGVRIDIPAYTQNGVYVQTVHKPATPGNVGDRIGYDNAVRLSGPVRFFVKEGSEDIKSGALAIKEGRADKHPIATVEGDYIQDRSAPSDINSWTAVGMNPDKHSYFYDKLTGEPVVGGSESYSVGNTVFVKDPVYGSKSAFRYQPAEENAKYTQQAEAWDQRADQYRSELEAVRRISLEHLAKHPSGKNPYPRGPIAAVAPRMAEFDRIYEAVERWQMNLPFSEVTADSFRLLAEAEKNGLEVSVETSNWSSHYFKVSDGANFAVSWRTANHPPVAGTTAPWTFDLKPIREKIESRAALRQPGQSKPTGVTD